MIPPEERLGLIKRVIESGEVASEIAEEANISRKQLYPWLKRYRQLGSNPEAFTKYMLRGDDYWENNPEIKKTLLQLIIEHPDYGYRTIAKQLQTTIDKKLIGDNRIYNFLHAMQLDTGEKRLAYAQSHSVSSTTGTPFHSRIYTFLTVDEKIALIMRVYAGETVVSVCKEVGVAESIFHVWLDRYITSGGDPNALAVDRKYPSKKEHYAYVPEAPGHILTVVAQYPEYGANRIGKEIEKNLGGRLVYKTTIERILKELHLNTYEQRRAYAASQHSVAPDVSLQEER